MSLAEKILKELNRALKNKDEIRVSTLRFLAAQIKDAKIEKKAELSDDETTKVLQKQQKQRMEAIELYRKNGREDLALKEEKEKEIIDSFLPEQMSDEEIAKIAESVIAKIGYDNFGQVMGMVMKEAGGRAEGGKVSAIVRSKIR